MAHSTQRTYYEEKHATQRACKAREQVFPGIQETKDCHRIRVMVPTTLYNFIPTILYNFILHIFVGAMANKSHVRAIHFLNGRQRDESVSQTMLKTHHHGEESRAQDVSEMNCTVSKIVYSPSQPTSYSVAQPTNALVSLTIDFCLSYSCALQNVQVRKKHSVLELNCMNLAASRSSYSVNNSRFTMFHVREYSFSDPLDHPFSD